VLLLGEFTANTDGEDDERAGGSDAEDDEDRIGETGPVMSEPERRLQL
jgi:hypothetical protein